MWARTVKLALLGRADILERKVLPPPLEMREVRFPPKQSRQLLGDPVDPLAFRVQTQDPPSHSHPPQRQCSEF